MENEALVFLSKEELDIIKDLVVDSILRLPPVGYEGSSKEKIEKRVKLAAKMIKYYEDLERTNNAIAESHAPDEEVDKATEKAVTHIEDVAS